MSHIYISDSLSKLISETMIKWAEEKHISDANLVRAMFHLLHRQYDGVGEVRIILLTMAEIHPLGMRAKIYPS